MSMSQRVLPDYTAAEIMTSPAVACREEAYLEEVAELLAERQISGVPVVNEDDEVVGVISERDLAHTLGGPMIRLALRRPAHIGQEVIEMRDVPRTGRTAKVLMTSPPTVAEASTPVHVLAELMVRTQINRVPIVSDNKLVGVVSRGDLLSAISGLKHHEIAVDQDPVIIGSGISAAEIPTHPRLH